MDFSKLKDYGEFKCPICKEIFHEKKKLVGHYGGAHKKGKGSKPICKFCGEKLIPGKNWPEWAIKQGNLICIFCKRLQNKKSYRKKIKNKRRI